MRKNLEMFHASHVLSLYKMGNMLYRHATSKERGVKTAYRLVQQLRTHKYTLEIKSLAQINLKVSFPILDYKVSFDH